MWQSSYSYDDSQTFAYGYQSSGSSGLEGQCENGAPQPGDVAQQDEQPGGFPSDGFQPEGSHYGEYYQTQEFTYYHSEIHVDSSAFQA